MLSDATERKDWLRVGMAAGAETGDGTSLYEKEGVVGEVGENRRYEWSEESGGRTIEDWREASVGERRDGAEWEARCMGDHG